MAKQNSYETAKNPNDGLWYVVGYCGAGKWMPVSSGFKNKKEK